MALQLCSLCHGLVAEFRAKPVFRHHGTAIPLLMSSPQPPGHLPQETVRYPLSDRPCSRFLRLGYWKYALASQMRISYLIPNDTHDRTRSADNMICSSTTISPYSWRGWSSVVHSYVGEASHNLYPIAKIFIVIYEGSRRTPPSQTNLGISAHEYFSLGGEMENRRKSALDALTRLENAHRQIISPSRVTPTRILRKFGGNDPSLKICRKRQSGGAGILPSGEEHLVSHSPLDSGCSLGALNRGWTTEISGSSSECAPFRRLEFSSSRSHQRLRGADHHKGDG